MSSRNPASDDSASGQSHAPSVDSGTTPGWDAGDTAGLSVDEILLARFVPQLKSADCNALASFLDDAVCMDLEAVERSFQWEKSRLYPHVWAEARRFASTTQPGHREELIAAIHAYTLHHPNISKEFNDACRRATYPEAGRDGWKDFEYKTFFLLLLEALFTLPLDTEDRVRSWRHGTSRLFRGIRDVRVLQKPGDVVVFGQFLSTSPLPQDALRFSSWSSPLLLELRGVPRHLRREVTCYGFYTHWEVLVAPFCAFRFAGERRDYDGLVVELDFVECHLHHRHIMRNVARRLLETDARARSGAGCEDIFD